MTGTVKVGDMGWARSRSCPDLCGRSETAGPSRGAVGICAQRAEGVAYRLAGLAGGWGQPFGTEDKMVSEEWQWGDADEDAYFLYEVAEELAALCFLSDNAYLPDEDEDYRLGYLEPGDWWPLVNQLDEIVDWETVIDLLNRLDVLLRLPGLPTELLESPLFFLEDALEGNLPPEPSGRRVGSRKLVKIGLVITRLLQEFPTPAQVAARAWADVHRNMLFPFEVPDSDELDLADLLSEGDVPPSVTGFGMMLAMTLMNWPERAEDMPLPSGFLDPELYDDLYEQWEELPDSPKVTEEGIGGAETLFAQGQLAHALAQLGTVEGLDAEDGEDGEVALAYSRLSRAILWLHNECRVCPQREGITCQAATNWPERPVPLLDIASEIANSGRIEGCIRM